MRWPLSLSTLCLAATAAGAQAGNEWRAWGGDALTTIQVFGERSSERGEEVPRRLNDRPRNLPARSPYGAYSMSAMTIGG